MIKLFEEFSKEPEIDIEYHDNGQKKSEEWWLITNRNVIRHREDGPVIKKWYKNGQNRSEQWWLNGKQHREDGPAFKMWYKNGQKQVEEWYLNNKKHREDGPALRWWYENGQKEYEEWYLNNKRYSREEWIEKLKEIGSEHYEEQKMLYDAEKYNL